MSAYREHWIRNTFKTLFSRENVLSLPNLLSLLRIMLVPVIIWVFREKQSNIGAVVLILISAATDIADGKIARKYNMTTDLGKILDPIADKLTQGAMVVCLLQCYPSMKYLLIIFVAKELIQALMAGVTLRKYGNAISAKWFGKASTVVFYSVMVVLFAFSKMPAQLSTVLIGISAGMLLLSLALYARFFIGLLLHPDRASN
ncbi:MAG: CDP-alcohol phosphatidyltransferase family protein [Clostridia bacterium]|nr:CDP-alcohol phosphatidyltransferase family protein [Clostridia bacterium]